MADGALALGPIGQIAIHADDMDAAVEFYRDVLGLPFIAQFPSGLAFFDCDGTRLMIEQEDVSSSTLYFKVPDIEEGFEALKARGVEFIKEPHIVHASGEYELKMAFFNDPSGNPMAIMAEKGSLAG